MNKYLRIFFSWLICFTTFAADDAMAQDTLSIYFQLNKHELTDYNTRKIDSILYNDIIKNDQKIMIVGYADNLGTDDHNIQLSKRRANTVKVYLTNMNVDTNMIIMCMGKGKVKRDAILPQGYATDRRVDIILNYTQPSNNKSKSSTSSRSIDVSKVPVGKSFILSNIQFLPERHVLTKESEPELERLYQTLINNPTLTIRIEGHVCCIWGAPDALDIDTDEMALSLNRAKYIYEYLIDKGIDAARLSYVGFGKQRPLVTMEVTEADRAMNRRVEIRILTR